jgi:sugar lactone lactonase YvrE
LFARRRQGGLGITMIGLALGWAGSTLGQGMAPAFNFTTVAGLAGSRGSSDGAGAAARFSNPVGVVVDRAGTVFVADLMNHTIRRIAPPNVVGTLAGTVGAAGELDGTGGGARFSAPGGLALDGSETLYVADEGGHTVRKITPAGVVTTLAGLGGVAGYADGQGASARFHHPAYLVVDAITNVLVADHLNHVIRRITPQGMVTTLAGSPGLPDSADGIGSTARFNGPAGLALDTAGNLFVADRYNHSIRRITPEGVVTTVAGFPKTPGSADGVGNSARFRDPEALTIDSSGNLYVAELGNHTIRQVTPAGVVSTVGGLAGAAASIDGPGPASRFNAPAGIFADQQGNLYVTEAVSQTLRRGDRQQEEQVTIGTYAGLRIQGFVGRTYPIRYTTDLTEPRQWITLTNLVLSESPQLWIDTENDLSSGQPPRRFYQVLGQP